MDCNYFENRLEALADGTLAEHERRACESHLAGCPACRELLELASLAPAPAATADESWLREVIARTSGSACTEAEAVLCALVDGEPLDGETAEGEHPFAQGHLARCGECAALLRALRALAVELPRMAEARPDERFVDDVLARTLPVPVRLRRFWKRSWPRWVHRPRFASEAAYVGMLVLVLVFATPGSPLEAVPRRALETVRTAPGAGLAAPVDAVEHRLEGALQEWRAAGSGRKAAGWYRAGEEALERAQVTAGEIDEDLESLWGTLRREIASLLGKAESPVPEPAHPVEETS